MRSYFIFLYLLFSFHVHADWEDFSSDDHDPCFYNHVSVITGNLNLSLQDAVVRGAIPIPINRTYTSAGALERNKRNDDQYLRWLRGGWLIQGGWNLFPQTDLLIHKRRQLKYHEFHIPEPSGNVVKYVYSHKDPESAYGYYYKPNLEDKEATGSMSGKTNVRKNRLRINFKKNECVLFLSNGGMRYYEGKLHDLDYLESSDGDHKRNREPWIYFRLALEVLPSKHKIRYEYDDKKRLIRICARNPDESKTFSWITIHPDKKNIFPFTIRTSDNRAFTYWGMQYKERDYLSAVRSDHRTHTEMSYSPARKHTGARVTDLQIAGRPRFHAHYYPPDTKHQKDAMDKVSELFAPIHENGSMVSVARFTYSSETDTNIRDLNNLLMGYRYSNGHLDYIRYHGSDDRLRSIIKFFYNGPLLKSKILVDTNGLRAHFSKSFQFDGMGNVTEESFWGCITGNREGPYGYNEDGSFNYGADSHHKHTVYDQKYQVPLVEEYDGLTIRYTYLPDTDLMTSKLTYSGEALVLSEYKSYNSDHLLIEEISDHLRKHYTLDAASGLPTVITERTVHPEMLIRRVELVYSPERLVTEERVFDATNAHRYTLYTRYDSHGNVIARTDPLGRESFYSYDFEGKLIEAKEPGQERKHFEYNPGGNITALTKGNRTTHSQYDLKGNLLNETDFRGHRTSYSYDCHGHLLHTESPEVKDENGDIYHPTLSCTHDIQGNIQYSQQTCGESTYTRYNALGKPVFILHPDHTKTCHRYDLKGNLVKTIHPDNTEENFTYDCLSHLIRKEQGNLVETWSYNASFLMSHTDINGLTTNYTYDPAGKKTEEEAEGRIKTFSYDALGFLERVREQGRTHVQIHDVIGRIIEEWDEYDDTRENYMRFFYNEENQKIKAIRVTSQGEAVDLFEYDGEGRLTKHIDPYNGATQWIYEDSAMRKTTIDPIGNQTIETYDSADQLIHTEKRDAQDHTLFEETHFYNRSQQKVRTVYSPSGLTHRFEYDSMGRVVKEIEADQKSTQYAYDCMGCMTEKILPSGIVFKYLYDTSGRLIETLSSDETVHYLYSYEKGEHPTRIQDLVNGKEHKRAYNAFGQLLSETNGFGLTYHWQYDEHGRVIQFTLPDTSTIHYTYRGPHLFKVSRNGYAHTYTKCDPCGHIEEEELINQLGTVRVSRDLLERFTSQTNPWFKNRVEYGPSSLITHITNTFTGSRDYSYDGLNQIQRENDKEYHFDSLGNPQDATINSLNQILETEHCKLTYNADGHPTTKSNKDENIHYTYDALGRLIAITTLTHSVHYTYDPFSRLLSKESANGKILFLYDHDHEIGTMTETVEILDLKVLGLGIKGDIGAAIALELDGGVFAPLHDSFGNIIAIVNPNGAPQERYFLDTFGNETRPPVNSWINPWRFASKRCEEGLYFFGYRFYDPTLCRWLTPDPAGFIDGPNLYAYVHNNTPNRLDLLGLYEDSFRTSPLYSMCYPGGGNVLYGSYNQIQRSRDIAFCRGSFEGIPVDVVIMGKDLHTLNFTPQEKLSDQVSMHDRMTEIFRRSNSLITFINGIGNSLETLQQTCEFQFDKASKNAVHIGFYNRCSNLFSDTLMANYEMNFPFNSNIKAAEHFFRFISDSLQKADSNIPWLHTAHSRGGGVSTLGIKRLENRYRQFLQDHMDYRGFGPSEPMKSTRAKTTANYYSEDDGITGPYGSTFIGRPKYNVFTIPSTTPREKYFLGFIDHDIMGKTYQELMVDVIDDFNNKYGLHNVK